jgi:hypothetical protein
VPGRQLFQAGIDGSAASTLARQATTGRRWNEKPGISRDRRRMS